MSEGNGIDGATVVAMLNTIITTLNRLEGRVERLEARVERLESRFDRLEARMVEQESAIRSLRQTLTEYHGSVLGHGIMITELEDRVRRIETHLGLSRLS